MLCVILSWFLFLGADSPPAELEAAVKDYWSSMAKSDKFSALKHVAKGSENNFIALRAPAIRSWKISDIQMVSPSEARVTVETDAWFSGTPSFQTLQARHTWIHDGTAWKIRVPKPNFRIDPTHPDPSTEKKPLEPGLRVSPENVKIPFLNTRQNALIKVANGTEKAARLEEVQLDAAKFQLKDRPTVVEPGQTVQMTLHYVGDEIAKDQKSNLTLVFKQDDEKRVFQIPIVYNYLSPQTRRFFGLTDEAAERLKRGDKVTPVFSPPGSRNRKASPAAPKPPAN